MWELVHCASYWLAVVFMHQQTVVVMPVTPSHLEGSVHASCALLTTAECIGSFCLKQMCSPRGHAKMLILFERL